MSIDIQNFFKRKTVKLTDSFIVKYNGEEVPGVVAFTLPVLEYDEQIAKYGNVSQVFLIPKYDNLQILSLTWIESADNEVKRKIMDNLGSYTGAVSVKQKYGNSGYTQNVVKYLPNNATVGNITIDILNNKLNTVILTHSFQKAKLISAKQYELNYSSEDTCKWELQFIFDTYTKEYK